MAKTLHMVRCKCCNTASQTCYAGWCPRCLMRGVRSMQAVSAPLMTFLVERGELKPGDKLPYNDELLALLRSACAESNAVVRTGDDLLRPEGTPAPGPVDAASDGADRADRALPQ